MIVITYGSHSVKFTDVFETRERAIDFIRSTDYCILGIWEI